MKSATTKKRVIRKHVKAANSPSPDSMSKCAPCGHSHCADNCRVRYVGPTSHIRDHHILHAARGITHVWTAVIIAGFAIVLTGAIAYNAANAQNQKTEQEMVQNSTAEILDRIDALESRINTMEKDVAGMFRAQSDSAATPDKVFPPLN